MAGKGNESASSNSSGRLIIQLNVEPSKVFNRIDDDIFVDLEIPVTTAMLGGNVRVPTISGDVELYVVPGSQPDERRRLRERGIHNEITGRKGHEYVTYKVVIPK